MRECFYDLWTLSGGKNMSDTREITATMGQKAGAVDESILSDEEKQRVDAFAKKIDILNIKMSILMALQHRRAFRLFLRQ